MDGKLPLWSPWTMDAAGPRTMLLDTPKGGGVRMAPETDSPETIVDQLLKDPAFKTQVQRCDLLGWTVKGNPELQATLAQRCKAG